MKFSTRTIVSAFVAAPLLALTAAPALALPPPDLPDCPDGYHPVGMRCVKNAPRPTPPKPTYSPMLFVDLARQTTDRKGVHVVGWTADADLPTSPLAVDVAVDGATVTTVTASVDRPDVAAAFPQFGAAHGYDLTLPLSDAGHTIRVTAHNFGSGTDTATTVAMDKINGFAANEIRYDLPHAVVLANTPQDLRRLDYSNGTTAAQQIELDLSGSTTETRGWQDDQSVKVSLQVEGGMKIPFFADGKVTVGVEGSASWQQNGQVSETKSWDFKQTTTIPAQTRVVASSAVSQTTLEVPYTMTGSWTYDSGATAPGTVDGSYTGLNSHDMYVTLTQSSLVTGSVRTTVRRADAATRFASARVLVPGHPA